MYSKKVEERVRQILTKWPQTRDSYPYLIGAYLLEYHTDPRQMTAWELLKMMQDKQIPAMNSITRASRKVQNEDPSLRGPQYNSRHLQRDKWQSSLGYTSNS